MTSRLKLNTNKNTKIMRTGLKIKMAICLFALLTSCEGEQEIQVYNSSKEIEQNEIKDSDDLRVSQTKALDVANKMLFGEKTRSKSVSEGQVSMIKDESNTPLMYVVNYPNEGFVIVSATQEYYPVLAYSTESNFSLDVSIQGVEDWLQETKVFIQNCEDLDDATKQHIQYLWKQYDEEESEVTAAFSRGSQAESTAFHNRISELRTLYPGYRFYSLLSCPADAFAYGGSDILTEARSLASQYGSPAEYTIIGLKDNTQRNLVGPLLTTTWHQGSPFNALCKNQYPAGCVAIAMAQVMNFHQFPTRYNWNNMPDETATTDTQELIAEIGEAVHMDYNPDRSESSIENSQKAFISNFGYSATIKDFNYDETADELFLRNRPVYMRGYDKQFLVIHKDGHAWVCDGADKTDYETLYFIEYRHEYSTGYEYDSPGRPSAKDPGVVERGTLLFHMNWGWQNGTYNGWYGFNDVKVDEYDFSHLRKNLYVYPIK